MNMVYESPVLLAEAVSRLRIQAGAEINASLAADGESILFVVTANEREVARMESDYRTAQLAMQIAISVNARIVLRAECTTPAEAVRATVAGSAWN